MQFIYAGRNEYLLQKYGCHRLYLIEFYFLLHMRCMENRRIMFELRNVYIVKLINVIVLPKEKVLALASLPIA